MEITQYKKECPSCGRNQYYTNKCNYYTARKKNKCCKSCKLIGNKCGVGNKSRLGIPAATRKRPFNASYKTLIRGAIKRNIICLLTYDEFLSFTKIDKCHYCEDLIVWIPYRNPRLNGGKARLTNLDRKNNQLGYTEDNCVVCCGRCNHIKGSYVSYEEMVNIGRAVRAYRGIKQAPIQEKTQSYSNLRLLDGSSLTVEP